jgi:hypothetical protein
MSKKSSAVSGGPESNANSHPVVTRLLELLKLGLQRGVLRRTLGVLFLLALQPRAQLGCVRRHTLYLKQPYGTLKIKYSTRATLTA